MSTKYFIFDTALTRVYALLRIKFIMCFQIVSGRSFLACRVDDEEDGGDEDRGGGEGEESDGGDEAGGDRQRTS